MWIQKSILANSLKTGLVWVFFPKKYYFGRKLTTESQYFGSGSTFQRFGNEWIFGNPRTRKYRLRWRETFRAAESEYFGSGSTF